MFINVVNSLPDAVLVVTDEGGSDRVEWANDAAAKLLSARPDDLVQLPLGRLMGETGIARVRARLEHRNAEPFRADLMRLRDGSQILVDARVTREPDRFEGLYLVSAREVRAAGRMEQLLAELQHAVIGTGPRAIVDGRALVRALDPVFRARRWSGALWEAGPEAATMRQLISGWGMGREAWRFAQSLIDQPVPYAALPVLEQVVQTGRGVFFDDADRIVGGMASSREADPDLAERVAGSLRARRMSRGAWAPIVTRRGVTHALSIVGVNMTEADFAAALLIANQIGAWMTMSELSAKIAHDEHQAALAEMASVVAHEIRAPAMILESTARRLEQQVAGDTRLEPSVGLLRRQIAALDGLVGRLLDHGRRLGELSEPAPVSRAVERALAELEIAPGGHRIDVELPSPCPIVRADPILLAHAIAELVQNALEHAPAGGPVRLRVEVHPSREGEEARISVENEGGVEPHVAAHMFEPFFSTKGKSGLGLAVARRVAAALHGRLDLDPGVERASVSLWLPIEPHLHGSKNLALSGSA